MRTRISKMGMGINWCWSKNIANYLRHLRCGDSDNGTERRAAQSIQLRMQRCCGRSRGAMGPARIRGINHTTSPTIPALRLHSPFFSHSVLRSAASSNGGSRDAMLSAPRAGRQTATRGLAGAAQFIIPPPTAAVIAPSREALRLYREILRTAKGFWWEDDYGQPFGEQLAKSARREFEDWRGERDPEVIANRIMVRLFSVCCGTYAMFPVPLLCDGTRGFPQITRHCLMDIQNQVR